MNCIFAGVAYRLKCPVAWSKALASPGVVTRYMLLATYNNYYYTTFAKITEYEELSSVTHFRLLYADIAFVPDMIHSNTQYGSSTTVLAGNNRISYTFKDA